MYAQIRVKTALTITTSTYYAKYMSSALRVKVSTVFTAMSHRYMTSALVIRSTLEAVQWRGRLMEADIPVVVDVYADAVKDGFLAAPERTMQVQVETREMKVV